MIDYYLISSKQYFS